MLLTHSSARPLQAQGLATSALEAPASVARTWPHGWQDHDGQGWLDPAVHFVHPSYRWGSEARERQCVSQITQQDWTPGRWAPSRGSSALGSVLHGPGWLRSSKCFLGD